MKTLKMIIILFAVLFRAAINLSADINDNAGSSSAQFLKIPSTSRYAGLGNAVTSIEGLKGGTVESLFHNPAGMATLDHLEISLNYLKWFEGMNYSSASAGVPIENIGTVGIGFSGLFYGDIPIITMNESGELAESGSMSANDMAFILSWGRGLAETLSAGVNVKLINQKLEDEKATSIGFDAGMMYKFLDNKLNTGAVIQNIGGKAKFMQNGYSLPMNIQVGASYRLIELDDHSVLAGADISKPNDDNIKIKIAGEYGFRNLLYVRFGYQMGNDLNQFTAGGGVQMPLGNNNARLDYALAPYGELNLTHMIGLTIGLGAGKKSKYSQKDEDKNNETLFQRAERFMKKKQYNKAFEEYSKIIKNDPKNIRAAYNIACIYSLNNDKDNAIKWLEYTIDLDQNIKESIINDPDFHNIKDTESYKSLIYD